MVVLCFGSFWLFLFSELFLSLLGERRNNPSTVILYYTVLSNCPSFVACGFGHGCERLISLFHFKKPTTFAMYGVVISYHSCRDRPTCSLRWSGADKCFFGPARAYQQRAHFTTYNVRTSRIKYRERGQEIEGRVFPDLESIFNIIQ